MRLVGVRLAPVHTPTHTVTVTPSPRVTPAPTVTVTMPPETVTEPPQTITETVTVEVQAQSGTSGALGLVDQGGSGGSGGSSSVYYANCSAARAAGAAPLYRGEPGYRSALDRDNDGVACE